MDFIHIDIALTLTFGEESAAGVLHVNQNHP
jgi:hypothetical protein